ncbi:helix-turn-helix domain-containing protein [Streptomyces sp. NPDC051597]|uniref:PucR family transcriptional regulator n=1 Tax=Streptomyces sp. NPDC051597 TaxID=3155049 RepID=UPI003414A118
MAGPWAALPRTLAAELRKEQSSTAAEVIRQIRQHVPEFSRPLHGKFGHGIQMGVETALAEFADLVEGGAGASADPGGERWRVYWVLGRGEFAEGRSLDALQAAYRLGARVAWRRYARAARRAGVGADQVVLLAEAVFAHIDEISAVSVRGYAEAQADKAGALGRRRHHLLERIVSRTTGPALEQAAAAAGWTLPDTVACVALGPPAERDRIHRRLPPDVLADLEGPEPFLLVPEPGTAFRDQVFAGALDARGAVVGPAVPLAMAADSLRWARTLLARLEKPGGIVGKPGGIVRCEERLPELLLLGDQPLVGLFADRRLRPLDDLTPKQATRLATTLLVWLQCHRGSAPEVAERLELHPQTVRQRLRRIEHLFGAALDDPDARFELEVALRFRLLAGVGAGTGTGAELGAAGGRTASTP